MSVPKNSEPIYNLSINSQEDIERAIHHSELYSQKFAEILDLKYSYSVDLDADYLNIGSLYTDVYRRSLGFATCPQVVRGVDDYRALLKHSFTICNDVLTPLFISAFKCHQEAVRFYATPQQQDSALAQMAETGKIAKTIAEEYEKLGKQFERFRDQEVQKIIALSEDQVPLYKKQRELEAGQSKGNEMATHSPINSVLKTECSSLDRAINSLWRLQTTLLNMKMLLRTAECNGERLTKPDLANLAVVKLMATEQSGNTTNEFYKFLEEKERDLDLVLPAAQSKKSLAEVMKSMKTGRTVTTAEAPKGTSIVNLLRSTPQGVEDNFENSYLNWLALAKINQSMISALGKAVVEMDETRNNILQMERNPLARALHATLDI